MAASKWPLAVCGVLIMGCANTRGLMVVAVPVTDLRAQPETAATPAAHDPLEETQLLYGERVRMVQREKGWALIEAIEQPEYTHHRRWHGYPGWVPQDTLVPWQVTWPPTIVVTEPWASTWMEPYAVTPSRWRFPMGARLRATDMGGHIWKVELLDGTLVWLPRHDARPLAGLQALSPTERRRLIVQNAQRFIGQPYYWGGRSPRAPWLTDRVTGVDCSGLVNLAYRAAGVDLPRDAHEQFMRAHRVPAPQLADLIFLSEPDNPKRITHVMLYAGDGQVIEGPGTGLAVRRISLEDRLGHRLESLTPGMVVGGRTVIFGTYIKEQGEPFVDISW